MGEDYDCNKKFKEWIIDNNIATSKKKLNQIDKESLRFCQDTEKRSLDRISKSNQK